MSDMIV